MELKVGSVVCSKAGRDKGKFLAVVGIEGKNALVCDGKERRLEKPKLKNPLHLAVTASVLGSETMATDKSIKKALATFGAGDNRKEG